MRLEHYSKRKLAKQLRQLLRKNLGVRKDNFELFFFGSRVTGKGNDRSDIDVGFMGRAPLKKQIEQNIKEDIEKLPILYSIDFVDFQTVSEDFKKIALDKIEKII